MPEVVRRNETDDGELVSLVIQEDGMIQTVEASPSNIIEYDTDILSELDEEDMVNYGGVHVSRITDEVFELQKDGIAVRNMPSDSGDVIEGIYDYVENNSRSTLVNVWRDIYEEQVDRNAVNSVVGVLFDEEKIERTVSGWVIEPEEDIEILLTWTGKIYHPRQNRNKGYRVDRSVAGNSVEAVQGGTQFLKPDFDHISEGSRTVETEDGTITFESDELMFIKKTIWLTNITDIIDDEPFWDYIRRFTQGEIDVE